jgi:hypothetical protein
VSRGDFARDLGQAREIARATLRQELRRTRGATGAGRLGGLISSLLLYLFAGLLLAMSLARGMDPFTVAVVSTSAFMILVALFVVMEFATIVTGPDDLAFYAPLPVAPRAYVAAKIGVTCLFGLVFAVTYAIPSLILLPVLRVPLGLFLTQVWALLDGAVLSCLIVIALLGLAVRVVPYKRIRGVAAWLQFAVFIFFYGGFALFQRAVQGSAFAARIDPSPLLLLAPSAWAPSFLRLGSGWTAIAGSVLSVAVPVLLFAAATAIVAHAYGGKLAEAAIVTTRARGSARRAVRRASRLWRSPEERGISLLIGNLFRHDQQFRMGILMIIPVTILYVGLIVVVNRVPLLDPFTAAGRAGFSATILLYLAVGFFPVYVKNALSYSTDAEAAWLLFTSPADPLRIVAAARRFIVVFFIAPYLLLLAVMYAVMTGAVVHTAQHFAMIAVLVMIETDILLLFFPQMPFSRKPAAGRRSGAMLLRMLAGVVILVPILLIVTFIYPFSWGYWPMLALLAAVMVVVRVTGGRHAARKLAREEFLA